MAKAKSTALYYPAPRHPLARHPVAVSFEGAEDLAHQSFQDECNINLIVDSYARTGLVNHVAKMKPQYGDAPDIDIFEAACIQAGIRSAEEDGFEYPEETSSDEPRFASEAISEDTPRVPLGSEGESPENAAKGESSGSDN